MDNNPYIDRLPIYLGEGKLRSALSASVEPIAGLESLPADSAKELLITHLKRAYVPNAQGIALVQRILEIGLAHAIEKYPNIATYISTSQSDQIEVNPEPSTWVVTGLAGVGKSATICALEKFLSRPPAYQASENCPERPVLGGLFLTVTGRVRHVEIVNTLARKLGIKERCETKVSDRFKATIRLEMYRQGCMFLVADESQTIASGKTAGAAFVNFVVFLRGFGIPVIIVGNYGMVHGMLAQQSQVRQRLLSDPYIFMPDSADDPDYIDHLKAYKHASGSILDIDPSKDALRINWLTGGDSRALLNLICIAYKLLRQVNPNQAKVTVDLKAMETAYTSQAYLLFREEIELLRKHLLTGNRIRQDLLCPFPLSGALADQEKDLVNQLRKHAVSRAVLESSITHKEKAEMASGQMMPPEFVSASSPGVKMPVNSLKKATANAWKAAEGAPIKTTKSPRRPPPSAADASRSWGASV